MDADTLETFVAVHRHRGFSRAARELHRTQPAISRRIALLERELGAPLFERTARGITLSQAGEVLLPLAERALATLRDAADAVRALRSSNAGPVTLVTVGTLAGPPLTTILKRFVDDYPAVDLSLRTARSVDVSELIRRGEATIGLRYERQRSPDLLFEELGSEPLLVACSPGHALAGQSVESLRDLRAERWIGFPEPPGQVEVAASHVFALFLTRGLGEVEWTRVDSMTAQKRLVEAGLGVALIPESSIVEERAARTIDIIRVKDVSVGAPVFVITRKGGFLSAAAQRLRELLMTEYAAAWTRADRQRRVASTRRTPR